MRQAASIAGLIIVLTAAILFSASLAHCQTISFAPQGSAALKALTGRRIKGVQIVSIIACPARISLPSISGGEVYAEAIAQGYQPILPAFARAVVNDAVSHNWRVFALEAFKVASIAAAGLGAGGVVKMSAAQLSALVIGHQIGDEIASRIQERIPNASPLLSALLDPAAKLDITQGCQVSAILAVYPRKGK